MPTTQSSAAKSISPAPSFSPSSSTSTTPSTASPTSPRSSQTLPASHRPHPATRQLRPPKSPLYIPAALRPTERPHRFRPSNPPTPPHSHSSAESLSRPQTPSARPTITTSLSRSSAPNATGFSTTPSSPTIPAPTAAGAHPHPTRTHWKPDNAAAICDEPSCNTTFSLLSRRHHCRRCGGVFCNMHSSDLVPLDVDAEFDPRGGWWRACGVCGGMWAEKAMNGFRGKNGVGPEHMESAKAKAIGMDRKEGEVDGQAAASVPRDWNWSTF